MIVGHRKAGRLVLVLAVALLLSGFVAVVWLHRQNAPPPTPKPPLHAARLNPPLSATRP
jgi:hypothetical protein